MICRRIQIYLQLTRAEKTLLPDVRNCSQVIHDIREIQPYHTRHCKPQKTLQKGRAGVFVTFSSHLAAVKKKGRGKRNERSSVSFLCQWWPPIRPSVLSPLMLVSIFIRIRFLPYRGMRCAREPSLFLFPSGNRREPGNGEGWYRTLPSLPARGILQTHAQATAVITVHTLESNSRLLSNRLYSATEMLWKYRRRIMNITIKRGDGL